MTVAGIGGVGIASSGIGVAVWMVGAGSCSIGDVAVTINTVVAGAIGAEVAGGLDVVVDVVVAVKIDK